VLDEFRSESAFLNKVLTAGNSIELFCKLDGVELSFEIEIMAIDTQNRAQLIYTSLPDKLKRYQKREMLRVPLISETEGHVTFFRAEGKACTGILHDLSGNGFGGLVASDEQIVLGDKFSALLELGFYAPISTEVEICFIGNETDKKYRRFGAHFITLNPDDRRLINKTIAEIQRKLIRKGVKPHTL
jgi:c-di-GMP-binding flagellar brake protein YcgR